MQRQKILVGKKNIIREIIYEKYNNNPKHNVWKLIREREREREREKKKILKNHNLKRLASRPLHI